MSEHAPTLVAPERAPDTPDDTTTEASVDSSTPTSTSAEVPGASSSEVEASADADTPETPLSRITRLRQLATERATAVLEKHNANTPDHEAAPDRKEHVKAFFKKMGNAVMTTLEAQGVIPLRSEWRRNPGIIRRYLDRRRNLVGNGFLSAEQAAATTSSDDIEDSVNDTETSTSTTPEADTHATPDTEDHEVDHTETTTEVDPEVEAEVASSRAERARERREARRQRRTERREARAARREERLATGPEGSLRERAKAAARKVGRGTLSTFFKRVTSAARAGASALKRSS